MGLQPLAEVVTCNINGLVRLVPGVDLGVDDVSLAKKFFEEAVYVGRERAERGVVAHETVDVNHEERPFLRSPADVRRRRDQRLG